MHSHEPFGGPQGDYPPQKLREDRQTQTGRLEIGWRAKVIKGQGVIRALSWIVRSAGDRVSLSVPLSVPHPDSPIAELVMPNPPETELL